MINWQFIISALAQISIFGFFNYKSADQLLDGKSVKASSIHIETKSPRSTESNLNTELVSKADLQTVSRLVEEISTRPIPFYDSTNFDNTFETERLTEGVIVFLDLKKMYPYKLETIERIWLREKLELSYKFKTLIFGFYANEQELFTTLVTFDSKYKIIDFKHIAYDEVAEGCSRTESFIGKNIITSFKFDFCNNQPIDSSRFKVNDTGIISASY